MPNRQNRRGRSKNSPRFIQLFESMMATPAWLSLSPQARAVYLEIERRYYGNNNGRIGLSVRQAATSCNIAKNTAQRAIVELQEKGFVDCAARGTFRLKSRHSAEWRLTRVKCDRTNDLPARTYLKWRPD